ncbi:hypothetical protein CRV02_07535 [Arcobacter sp. CECT 8989]|uniref:hypothetical protein n=1 Tax=Arcobacter sp. CECT 8989 TaxID=2044509 RepID=UPI00100A8615|nr:hypothetical protein [Arcobacter sp. CECT 8989]RXK01725.1 hypothetical protein CRV02_07535 [Arcobacter sp. CECT 8989]
MKDIVNSFKAHMYERTSSPLLGAFIFYWIIFNYKFLIVLFSDLKPIEKFNEISSNVYPSWIEQYGCGLALPIIATLLYILYFPKISNKIHEKWIEHQNELKKISNKRVLTYEEYGDLQRRFTELELSFDETFSKKDNEIINLKKSIDKKEELNNQTKDLHIKQIEELHNKYKKEINELNNTINSIANNSISTNNTSYDLSPNESKIMYYIGNDPKNHTTQLSKTSQMSLITLEHLIDGLIEKNLVEKVKGYEDGTFSYKLTKEGRKAYVNNGDYIPF